MSSLLDFTPPFFENSQLAASYQPASQIALATPLLFGLAKEDGRQHFHTRSLARTLDLKNFVFLFIAVRLSAFAYA